MPKVMIDKDRCKGCELCTRACPQEIIEMSRKINAKGYFYAQVVNPSRCIGCRMCAITCPEVAMDVFVHGAQYVYFDY